MTKDTQNKPESLTGLSDIFKNAPIVSAVPVDPPRNKTSAVVYDDGTSKRFYLYVNGAWVQIGAEITIKSNQTSHGMATEGAQVIAHGLGRIPKLVEIKAYLAGDPISTSEGTYDGDTKNCIFTYDNTVNNSSAVICRLYVQGTTDYNAATITVDDTNITLTWTKVGTPSGTAVIIWKAFA